MGGGDKWGGGLEGQIVRGGGEVVGEGISERGLEGEIVREGRG